MNNEILKRDLASRLMERVKIDYNGTSKELTGIIHWLGWCASFKSEHGNTNIPIKSVKPYLFPTSALTKPIQIANYNNREPFVPIEMIEKVLIMEWCPVYDEALEELKQSDCRFNALPFDFIELMQKWHINYRLSPDQFIEVTGDNNPYV